MSHNPRTAPDAYAHHLRRCDALLGWIKEELQSHQSKAQQQRENRGYAGDLIELESLLKRALIHLSSQGEARVEQALAELKE